MQKLINIDGKKGYIRICDKCGSSNIKLKLFWVGEYSEEECCIDCGYNNLVERPKWSPDLRFSN